MAANDNRQRWHPQSFECEACQEDIDGMVVLCRDCAQSQGQALILGAAQGLECERCGADEWLEGRIVGQARMLRCLCRDCWEAFFAHWQ